MSLLLLLACTGAPKDESAAATPEDSAPTEVDAGELATLGGDVSWAVDFGATSESAGAVDCTYTRTYSGEADASAPWLCPECEAVFLASVEMSAGLEDCFAAVSTSAPLEAEYLGYGGGSWYRGAGSWMTERGPATLDGDTLSLSQEVSPEESGGDYAFHISGTLTLGTTPGDPLHGYVAPASYTCGWPKADPAPYTGDYVGTVGAVLPDGVFTDDCGEPVRLQDFAGSYLVVDISAMDCGPCQDAADEEEAFVEDMAAQGLSVRVITLLAPSLSDTAGTPTAAELDQWIGGFGLTSPVLADRAWGLSVVGQHLEDFGYPTFVLVDPSLEILAIQVGFGDWSDLGAVLTTDAG